MPKVAELNFDLLRFLKEQERPVLPSDIEKRIDVSHSELIVELEKLADIGYEIEMHPYLGVRLLDIPDKLLKHEITSSLNTKIIGKRMHISESCGSTSDEAWQIIESGKARDGQLVITDHQTHGRGRMGRSWESTKDKGLYFSFIAKIKLPPDRLTYLMSAATLAIANTIEQFVHLPATIKWPNDVFIGEKKVAGVLVEARSTYEDIYVVGVGVNVNHRKTDFPEHLHEIATSLRIERKSGSIHRIRLLRPLLFYLDNIYAQLRKKKFERISRAWKEFITIIGKEVILRCDGHDYSGTLLEMDPGEGVRIKTSEGKEQTFRAEHVSTLSENIE